MAANSGIATEPSPPTLRAKGGVFHLDPPMTDEADSPEDLEEGVGDTAVYIDYELGRIILPYGEAAAAEFIGCQVFRVIYKTGEFEALDDTSMSWRKIGKRADIKIVK